MAEGVTGNQLDLLDLGIVRTGENLYISGGTPVSGDGGKVEILGGAGGFVSGDSGDLILGTQFPANGAVGNVILLNLPTADPMVANAVWNDAGTLKISAGA